jgi:membrane protease YdiL (CAAX protease family)
MLARVDGRPPGALGFALTPATLGELALGFLVGSVLIGAATALLLVSGSARFVPDVGTGSEYARTLAWTLGYFLLAAAYEEVWFRGYGFQALVEGIGVWPSVLLTSALFSSFHLGNPEVDAIAIANIFLAGVLLAFAYLRTRSLWLATTLHAGWNWTMATALGFPVSGLVLLDTPLYDAVETGADWWTGGAFGPEAGLAGTAVLLAGLAWVLRTDRLREPPAVRNLRPLVDSRLLESGA